MEKLTVISWNSRGLNSPRKQMSTFDFLYRKNADFAYIQETHFLDSDVHRFENEHYRVITHSFFESKSKGVLILAKRKLNLIITEAINNPGGRIAYCKVIYKGTKMALVNIYAPNNFDKDFYDSVTSTLFDLTEYQIILGGNFNAVWQHSIDRTGAIENRDQQLSSENMRELAQEFDLIDVWRTMNPVAREFSFFSGRHKSFSRIDYILVSKRFVENIHNVSMIPFPLSDHKVVLCSLSFQISKPRAASWRFNTTLLQNEIIIQELTDELKWFTEINSSCNNPQVLWDVVKGYIRNKSISFATILNRSKKQQIEQLEKEIISLEKDLEQNRTSDQARN